MEGSITCLIEKNGILCGKISLSQEYLFTNKLDISNQTKTSRNDSKSPNESPAADIFRQTSTNTTKILNVGTELKRTLRNYIFKAGISPAQETVKLKMLSIPVKRILVFVSIENCAKPVIISASLTETSHEFLSRNKSILNIRDLAQYKFFTSKGEWIKDYERLGEYQTRNFTLEKVKQAIVRTMDGKSYQVDFWNSCLVSDFIRSFQKKWDKRASVEAARFTFKTHSLKEHCQMRTTGVEHGSVVMVQFLATGGGSFTCDIDLCTASKHVGKGVPWGPSWQAYTHGLNIVCRCHNTSCESYNGSVVLKVGYPILETITPQNFSYECPACHDNDLSIVTFLVSAARTKFTFLKCGSGEEETVLLESDTNVRDDFVVFRQSDVKNTAKTKYDYINILTVKFGESFNKCQQCNKSISLKDEEVMPCGRAFHSFCLGSSKTCTVCTLPDYHLNDLPDIAMSSTGSVTFHIPNHKFGDCKLTDKVAPKYLGLQFIATLSKSSKQRNELAGFKSGVEEQQIFILNNLSTLIRDTSTNTTVIAKLRQLDILSSEDEDTLVH